MATDRMQVMLEQVAALAPRLDAAGDEVGELQFAPVAALGSSWADFPYLAAAVRQLATSYGGAGDELAAELTADAGRMRQSLAAYAARERAIDDAGGLIADAALAIVLPGVGSTRFARRLTGLLSR